MSEEEAIIAPMCQICGKPIRKGADLHWERRDESEGGGFYVRHKSCGNVEARVHSCDGCGEEFVEIDHVAGGVTDDDQVTCPFCAAKM